MNPENSTIHTFDETVAFLRGNARNFKISGVPGRINNESTPNVIYLDFSKDLIFSTAAQNSRVVTFTYSTADQITDAVLDGDKTAYILLGNVLPSLPPLYGGAKTHINIRAGEGLQFGTILPQTEVKDNVVSYYMSKEERRVLPAFNVEIHFARYRDYALSNKEFVKNTLSEAQRKAGDAEAAIQNAEVYEANTTLAISTLRNYSILAIGSNELLKEADALLSKGESYQAYILTNVSAEAADLALKAATNAEKEANLRLKNALNEKIFELKNLTATPSPTTTLPVTRAPEQPTTTITSTTTTLTLPEEPESPPEPARSVLRFATVLLFILIVFTTVVLFRRKEGAAKKQAGVKDFRSIADLKRKSYKDFEEKVVDVKKETTIAGQIRSLSMEKKKYELGLENLEKKKVAGELDDNMFKTEIERFKTRINELEEQITSLESELKKGGSNGKSNPVRPKKG